MKFFNSQALKKPSSKIIITVFSGLFAISAYFIVSNYFSFLSFAEKSTLSRLEAIANTLSHQINGDYHSYISSRYQKQGEVLSNKQDDIYYQLWLPLRKAQDVNKLETEISTLVFNSDSTFSYIINSTDTPYVRDPYDDFMPEFITFYTTGGVIHQYTDEFGTWLTAIAPIKNSKGEVVGMIEVDEKFDVFIAAARKKLTTNLIISIAIFVFIALIMLRYIKQIIEAEEESKRIIQESSEIISQKNKDILDSINYAKRIQNAILAPKEEVFSVFKNAFILYKPKDIVSGDFYYFSTVNNKAILAAADCTGHGVPGALMSMIGNDLLNHITKERKIEKPSEILDLLHKGITNVLKQDNKAGETRDGMDIALLSFDFDNNVLEYAGAYRSLTLVRDGVLTEYKANKFPIGNAQQDRDNFTNNTINLQKGDTFYFFTDGYADQFGGESGKKFMVKKFHNLLIECSKEDIKKQEQILDTAIENWKGDHEQVDDILVIGVRV
ncbi:MAG: SpoIIE family protein phosphatase [Bacteroidota bacterium]